MPCRIGWLEARTFIYWPAPGLTMLPLVAPLVYMKQEQKIARSPMQECSPIITGIPLSAICGTSADPLLPDRITRVALKVASVGCRYGSGSPPMFELSEASRTMRLE